MKFLALVCWVAITAVAALASDPPRKIIETRSYPNSWDADMGALDLLAKTLQEESGATGVIFVYGSNREVYVNIDRRIRCFLNYMTRRRGIPSDRVRVMIGGYRKHATIELWVVPKGAQPPGKTPTLGREDVRPTWRGARYRCAN